MPRSIRTTIRIRTTPHRVLEAFLQHEHLHRWWGVERSLVQPHNGGVYALTWGISEAGFRYVSSGIIETYDPGSRLKVANYVYYTADRPLLGPMSLEISVRAEGSAAVVDIVQNGYGEGPDWEWYREAVKEAWPKALGMLKGYVEKNE